MVLALFEASHKETQSFPMTDLSRDEARRIAVAAQGFADPRPAGRVDIRHLRRILRRVGLLQIDSVNVLVRSHYLPLFSRLGPYPVSLLDDAVYRRRELFETWAHVASLVPVEVYPLLRYRMDGGVPWKRLGRWVQGNGRYIDAVLDEVRRKGPLSPAELEDPGGRAGPWWGWSKGKNAMEWHFRKGRVMVHDRRNFERVYDLTERILPRRVLVGDALDEAKAQRALLLLAARSCGVGIARDLADYYRLPLPRARELLRELASAGTLREVRVEGWREPAYMLPDARLPRSVAAHALLSPFDSLIWERSRTERLFAFHYRIEVYLPERKRQYGYYVLPYLLGDRLAARVDLKADRARSLLLVKGAFVEREEDPPVVARELATELRLMAEWLRLEDVSAARRGNLSVQLREALRRPKRRRPMSRESG